MGEIKPGFAIPAQAPKFAFHFPAIVNQPYSVNRTAELNVVIDEVGKLPLKVANIYRRLTV